MRLLYSDVLIFNLSGCKVRIMALSVVILNDIFLAGSAVSDPHEALVVARQSVASTNWRFCRRTKLIAVGSS